MTQKIKENVRECLNWTKQSAMCIKCDINSIRDRCASLLNMTALFWKRTNVTHSFNMEGRFYLGIKNVKYLVPYFVIFSQL